MLDVVTEVNQVEKIDSLMEDVGAVDNGEDEILKTNDGKQRYLIIMIDNSNWN
jgi:hypothetical protein